MKKESGRHWEELELISRESSGTSNSSDFEDELYYDDGYAYPLQHSHSRLKHTFRYLFRHLPVFRTKYHKLKPSRPRNHAHSWIRLVLLFIASVLLILISILAITGIFWPSYTHYPEPYAAVQKRARDSNLPGRANVNNEKVFIATSVYDKDGELASGLWGEAILDVIDLLGPDNVYFSLYENNVEGIEKDKLDRFADRITCNSTIISEHLNTQGLAHVSLPSGERYLKRVAFLAEVRNRALKPLNDPASAASAVRFDKVLYLNDIIFNPVDAANLLFSTNVDEQGKAQYRAACATDFIMPFKFYDTFATRDLEGYSLGVPFYPWFTASGSGHSRKDVIAQKDAVRVRSCWGGMVAFDAKYFQAANARGKAFSETEPSVSSSVATSTTLPENRPEATTELSATTHADSMPDQPLDDHQHDGNLNWHLASSYLEVDSAHVGAAPTPTAEDHHQNGNLNWHLATSYPGTDPDQSFSKRSEEPLVRFRADSDPFWDSSECCLVHADIQAPRGNDTSEPTGIYINPYIRVAYDKTTLSWLPFTRRFERLYPLIHYLVDRWVSGLPGVNPRRTEEAGQTVIDRVWVYDIEEWKATGKAVGSFQDVRRKAQPGGFCGKRQLLVLPREDSGAGWFSHPGPPDDDDPTGKGFPVNGTAS